LRNRNRRSANLAPDHVDTLRCVPKDGPLDFDIPDRPPQRAMFECIRVQLVEGQGVCEGCARSQLRIRPLEKNAVLHLHGLGNFEDNLTQEWSPPMSLGEDPVGLGERLEPPIKITQTLRVRRPETGPGDRLHDSQHVVDPVSEFERRHFALALELDAIGDFDILLDDYISTPEAPQTLGPYPSPVARG